MEVGVTYSDETIYYDVFHRTWWCYNKDWPQGLKPQLGIKHYIQQHLIYTDAVALCKKWNDEHKPGPLSDKAEFEEE